MGIQDLLNNPFAFNFVLRLGKTASPGFSHWLIRRVANLSMLRRSHSGRIQAMIANQWVIHQGKLNNEDLEKLVLRTLIHRMNFQYDLYHHLKEPKKLKAMISLSPNAAAHLQKPYAAILAGPHTGNFDLLAWSIAQYIPHVQAISIANPSQSYKLENKFRRQAGMDVTPASIQALKEAAKRLRAGKPIMTGIDRPFTESGYAPQFFGRPAPLPVTHTRLALNARVPVIVMAAIQQPDGCYRIEASAPIPMQSHSDHDTEIIKNAETVLKAAEKLILTAPDQWGMFYPVWPEILHEAPLPDYITKKQKRIL
ncbi:MAG: lysophospholipid acyltransferase family protein [Anaerolineaceae bacterium]|nr:lysophospholipid acyltransferase family protein [Anaerolineaceae bacterium]